MPACATRHAFRAKADLWTYRFFAGIVGEGRQAGRAVSSPVPSPSLPGGARRGLGGVRQGFGDALRRRGEVMRGGRRSAPCMVPDVWAGQDLLFDAVPCRRREMGRRGRELKARKRRRTRRCVGPRVVCEGQCGHPDGGGSRSPALPLKRVGLKGVAGAGGEGAFERCTWDEALTGHCRAPCTLEARPRRGMLRHPFAAGVSRPWDARPALPERVR